MTGEPQEQSPGNGAGSRAHGAGVGTLPSLKWFLGGIAPWAVIMAVTRLWTYHLRHDVLSLYGIVLLGWSPFCFFLGARLAWEERGDYGVRARVSRWLNVLALALFLGLLTMFLISSIGHTLWRMP